MDRHVTILGVIYIAAGILGLVSAAFFFMLFAWGALLDGDWEAIAITSTFGGLVGGVVALFAIPEIIAGIGLLKRQEWARILALILGVIGLTKIPIGTAIGIYTIWALTKREAVTLFNPRMQHAST